MKEITEIKKIGKGLRYDVFVDEQFLGTFEAEIHILDILLLLFL